MRMEGCGSLYRDGGRKDDSGFQTLPLRLTVGLSVKKNTDVDAVATGLCRQVRQSCCNTVKWFPVYPFPDIRQKCQLVTLRFHLQPDIASTLNPFPRGFDSISIKGSGWWVTYEMGSAWFVSNMAAGSQTFSYYR